MTAKLPILALSILCFLQIPSNIKKPPVNKTPVQNCDEKTRPLQDELVKVKHELEVCRSQSKVPPNCGVWQAKATDFENKLHACESANKNLNDENQRLKKSNETEKYKTLFEAAIFDSQKVKAQNTALLNENAGLQRTIDDFKARLGTETAKYADIFEQSKKIKNERVNAELSLAKELPAEKPEAKQIVAAETYKTLLAADEIAGKTAGDTSIEYRTVTEGGKTYQLRELMIGTLLFPDPSTLKEAMPNKPFTIEVKFKPNSLLKNSSADGSTNWILDFNFAPDRIKDFNYDTNGSGGPAKRSVGKNPEETWLWKTEKMPDNFSADRPRVQIDASAVVDGQEIDKKMIENRPLDIQEKPVPGFFAGIFDAFIKYSTILLIFTTTTFGVGTAFFGLKKAKIEKEMKETDARNKELEHQIAAAQ